MKTVSLEQEINPWEAQSARFNFAAQKRNRDEGVWKVLQYPNRELIVHIPVSMDNGKLEVFTGFRVQHSIARGPFFFSSRRRHTSYIGDWSSDVCSSDLAAGQAPVP